MPYTHCQIFNDDGGTTLFTFPAGTTSAKIKCIGHGFTGVGQNAGGGGGYAEVSIASPILTVDAYRVAFFGDGSTFKVDGQDPLVLGAHATDFRGGGITAGNIGDASSLGGNGGEVGIGTGGCGGGGCGGPLGAGQNGAVNSGSTGGAGGVGNNNTGPSDLTEGIGDTRVIIGVERIDGSGGNGGNAGNDGLSGNYPGGGGGGQGDSPPTGPGAAGIGVVVVLYTVASFVPKVIII